MQPSPPHKWEEIASAIRDAITSERLRPGDRVQAERDLAGEWGVSRMTAHRALQELQRQGWVIRQRGSGTVVAEPAARSARCVAMLYHNNAYTLEAEYIRGVRAAIPDGIRLVLCEHQDDVHREARHIRSLRAETDGIVLIPSGAPQNTPLLRETVEAGTALVCVDRVPDGLDVDAALTDNFCSTLDALRSLGPGVRIAHLTADLPHISAARERLAAYVQVCHEAGITDPAPLIRRYPLSAIADRTIITQLVTDTLAAMLHRSAPPTAVFCLNDFLLAPVLDACDDLGIQVPRDLAVVSFNDAFTLMRRHERVVHRIVQRTYDVGRTAGALLLERLRQPGQAHRVVRVPAEFRPADPDLCNGPGTH